MKKFKRILLSDTARLVQNWVPPRLGYQELSAKKNPDSRAQRSCGIMVVKNLKVPALDAKQLQLLDSSNSQYITRHFNAKKLLQLTLEGSYKFGTIAEYNPQDEAQIGRFGDFEEGNQREVFHSRSGVYNMYDSSSFQNNMISGADDPFVIQFEINDYCSCVSRGEFDEPRAKLLRERGNPDIDAYVVYDLKKLKAALCKVLAEDEATSSLQLISRDVLYGQKDRHWEIEDHIELQKNKDQLALWLGIASVKSPDYKHEEEIRLIAIDPDDVGALPKLAGPIIREDARIKDAIVAYGLF